MNRQIRRLGVALLVLYVALFVQLNLVQVLRAEEYNDNPLNTRAATRNFTRPRGQILAADGTVLAVTVPAESGDFEQQRVYPEGELFGHVTGFFSFLFGSDGVELAYGEELSGQSVANSVRNFVDLFLDEQQTADVTLTIPTSVQQVARDALGEQRGAVVAIDPRDGAILALWSFPSYDPSLMSVASQEQAQAARDLLLADPTQPLLHALIERLTSPDRRSRS